MALALRRSNFLNVLAFCGPYVFITRALNSTRDSALANKTAICGQLLASVGSGKKAGDALDLGVGEAASAEVHVEQSGADFDHRPGDDEGRVDRINVDVRL